MNLTRTTEEQLLLRAAVSHSELTLRAMNWVRANNPSNDVPYHNVFHTESVALLVHQGAREEQLNAQDTEALVVAALFHDFAHTAGHQPDDLNIARALCGFYEFSCEIESPAQREWLRQSVTPIIAITQYPYEAEPKTVSEMLIRDADLMQITLHGWESIVFDGLLTELRVGRPKITQAEFIEGARRFYAEVVFYSKWAQARRSIFLQTVNARCNQMAQS